MQGNPVAAWRTVARHALRATTVLAVALNLLLGIQVRGEGGDYRQLRYEGVVAQSSDYSCGPAAAATLLSCFYGRDVGEGEVLRLTEQYEVASGRDLGAGVSALSLKRALAEYGVPVRGLTVSLDALVQHFAQHGLPLILHTTKPRKHFLVAVAIIGDWFVLADPSWGRRLLRVRGLVTELGFDGVALAPMPPIDQAERAASSQAAFRKWAGEMVAELSALREYMLWP